MMVDQNDQTDHTGPTGPTGRLDAAQQIYDQCRRRRVVVSNQCFELHNKAHQYAQRYKLLHQAHQLAAQAVQQIPVVHSSALLAKLRDSCVQFVQMVSHEKSSCLQVCAECAFQVGQLILAGVSQTSNLPVTMLRCKLKSLVEQACKQQQKQQGLEGLYGLEGLEGLDWLYGSASNVPDELSLSSLPVNVDAIYHKVKQLMHRAECCLDKVLFKLQDSQLVDCHYAACLYGLKYRAACQATNYLAHKQHNHHQRNQHQHNQHDQTGYAKFQKKLCDSHHKMICLTGQAVCCLTNQAVRQAGCLPGKLYKLLHKLY